MVMPRESNIFDHLARLEAEIDKLLDQAAMPITMTTADPILPVLPDTPPPTIPEDEITRNLSYEA